MARRQVVEVQCSRCERVERRETEHKTGEVIPAEQFRAEIHLRGDAGPTKVCFEDLCGPCERTVKALLEQIGKKIEGVSPDRKPGEEKKPRKEKKQEAKKEEQTPPASAAPHASHHNGHQATAVAAAVGKVPLAGTSAGR